MLIRPEVQAEIDATRAAMTALRAAVMARQVIPQTDLSTTENLIILIRRLAAHTNRAPSTISRLVTGSGDTLRRMEIRKPDGKPRHRISVERVDEATAKISAIWPRDLEWPSDIPRPLKEKEAA